MAKSPPSSAPQTPPDIVISTKDLARSYQSYEKTEGFIGSLKGFWERKHTTKHALKPTTLEFHRGQIVGLVGANGAGKTTLLKILSGLIHPSSGDAQVLGYRPWERDFRFLSKMSILLGQKNQLWWDLAPADSFRLLGEIYDISQDDVRTRVSELSQVLDCGPHLKTQLRRLSLGERMKMEIIGALLHRPELLFLDEPTIGLDIVAQKSIREFLATYVKKHHPTIILTSHYMDDIARLANRLLLISKGEIVYDGTVSDFVKKTDAENKILFDLKEPLGQDLTLKTGETLKAGVLSPEVKVKKQELPTVLSQITALPGIQNLRVEEVDFEDVIHRFMEKESGVFQAGHPAKP